MIDRLIKGVEKKTRDVNRIVIILIIQVVFVMTYAGILLWTVISHPEALNVYGDLTIGHLISYLPPILIGPPIVYIMLRSLVYRYKGAKKANFRTYIDSHFYNDFVRFSSKYRLDRCDHLQSSKRANNNNRIYDPD